MLAMMLTMAPPFSLKTWLKASWVTKKVPLRLVSTTARHPLGEIFSAGDGNCPPALLTRIVEGAAGGDHLLEKALDLFRLADVEREGVHRATFGANQFDAALELLFVATANHHGGAQLRQFARGAQADAGATAGDHRHLAGKEVGTEYAFDHRELLLESLLLSLRCLQRDTAFSLLPVGESKRGAVIGKRHGRDTPVAAASAIMLPLLIARPFSGALP